MDGEQYRDATSKSVLVKLRRDSCICSSIGWTTSVMSATVGQPRRNAFVTLPRTCWGIASQFVHIVTLIGARRFVNDCVSGGTRRRQFTDRGKTKYCNTFKTTKHRFDDDDLNTMTPATPISMLFAGNCNDDHP